MQAEGPEPLTRLCSPALQTRTAPGSHTSCHAHPTLTLAEGSAGPDAKKGWQQWAQRAPPRHALVESGGLQAPHGGRPGEGVMGVGGGMGGPQGPIGASSAGQHGVVGL